MEVSNQVSYITLCRIYHLARFRRFDHFRQHRRTFHETFQPRAMQGYFPIIRRASLTLVSHFASTPENFASHIRQ
jgi:cytochrome P450